MPLMMWIIVLGVALVGKLSPTVASSSCTIDDVLVEASVEGNIQTDGARTTEVDVRALASCHNHDATKVTLKTANPQGSPSMRVLLTHPDYGQPYRRSCRAGLLTSIYTKGGSDGGDNKIHAKIELLLCFCQLGGGFDTDVIFHQGHYLVDGNARVDRTGNLDVFDTHEFNEDGLTMCKELRRRALAHCIRALDDQSSASQKLPTCMSLFDHLAGLVKHESHITRTAFKPVFEKNWPTSLIDDLIAHETATLWYWCHDGRGGGREQ